MMPVNMKQSYGRRGSIGGRPCPTDHMKFLDKSLRNDAFQPSCEGVTVQVYTPSDTASPVAVRAVPTHVGVARLEDQLPQRLWMRTSTCR